MKEPPTIAKVAAPGKKAATNRKPKTPPNEVYAGLLSKLELKLSEAESRAFEIWKASQKTEDLANWLQAQNQLRITAALLGKLAKEEAE